MSPLPILQKLDLGGPEHSQHNGDVTAWAILERSRYSLIWIVEACPYCGKSHHHYAGSLNGNPYRYVDHRVRANCDVADCQDRAQMPQGGSMDYLLRSADDPHQAGLTLAVNGLCMH